MKRTSYLTIALISMAVILLIPTYSVRAQETFLWGGNVPSTGEPVASPLLEAGRQYRIVAKEIFWYDYPNNLAADAQYFTTNPFDSWNWLSYSPAPDGHSFLQIDEMDVNWGPISNGDTGHTYTIYYTGTGASVTFRIIDWIDGTGNNMCHLPVEIYALPPPPPPTGESPGYWKHQFLAYYAGKGKPQVSWNDLLAYTESINSYYGKDPPDFYGYALGPVSAFDYDDSGVLTTLDAYNVFTHKPSALWIQLAQWYNWAAGYGPYYDYD